ncbi:MAG: glycoside hydrolase family 3 C-terminal domain-containing protein, partial [Oscillospiraceae bacterium]|nr:glycoside hydrolase family 3 C-terminal domain-containing protein [Oscillospiraceae bacterium]
LRRVTLTDALPPIISAAQKSDTVIIVLGNHPLINGRECFDRPSIEFPEHWKRLIKEVSAANKNVILTIVAGYPYAFPKEEKQARALLYTAHGEQDVGSAVADVLFGKYNPAGRLSMTWYLSGKDLPPMDNYDIINYPRTYMYFDKPVQYPFGYGLSYTEFEYSRLAVKESGRGYTVSCFVKNKGKISGDEVAQLYATLNDVRQDGAPVKAPIRKLVGFERVNLAAGESKKVTFKVPNDEVRLYDEKSASFALLPKSITFAAGASCADIRAQQKVDLAAEI